MRKPVDQLKPPQKRQAVWDAIKRLGIFTVTEVWKETALKRDTVSEYVTALEAFGCIRHTGFKTAIAGQKAKVYEHVKEMNFREAPRLRKDGTKVTQGIGRELMWRTMRILKEFSVQDLAITASTEEHQVATSEAEYYCRYCCLAGFLKKTSDSPLRYRFLMHRYTGPKPPQIQRVKQVWDPNTGEVAWAGGES